VTLEEAMSKPRVAVAGVPRAGKTTLAEKHGDGRRVIHTDDSIGKGTWQERRTNVIRECEGLSSFIVEGTLVADALRKGLKVDVVVLLPRPHAGNRHSVAQAAMAKGTDTLFKEWRAADSGRTPVVVVR
jgi:hypothetical protein